MFGLFRKKDTEETLKAQHVVHNNLNSDAVQNQGQVCGITPTKTNPSEDNEDSIKTDSSKDTVISNILKSLLCVFLPFLFPTIVYSTEGYCLLFWQAAVASTTVTVLLLLLLLIAISNRTQWIRRAISKRIPVKVKTLFEDTQLCGQEIRYYLANLIIFITILVCGGYACQRNMWYVLDVCLVLLGFLLGVVSNQLYSQLAVTENHLPIASPCRVKVSVTKSSPMPSTKRKLNFSGIGKSDRSCLIPLHIPNPTTTRIYNVLSPGAVLPSRSPITPPPTYKKSSIQELLNQSYSFLHN